MKHIAAATLLAIGTAVPVQSDPTIGFGLSLVFGGGSMETGIGLRVFSDDEEESAVASIGLDYVFQANRLRPTVGLAYLDESFYVGLDMGLDLIGGAPISA